MTADAQTPEDLFKQFCASHSFREIQHTFLLLCKTLQLESCGHRELYNNLKSKINTDDARALWKVLDKRASHVDYLEGQPCKSSKVFVVGAGPCGLRTAIEAAFLGAKVVVVEQRDYISRNNVLHLWPFVIQDLKSIGAKIFYPQFGIGALDHVSIRRLQCILMKIAMVLGIEIHAPVTFEGIREPDKEQGVGFRARVAPEEHHVSNFEFDIIVGADGRRNTLGGFQRRCFRGKQAIAVTANFINHKTRQDALVEEIGGLFRVYAQAFFDDLKHETGIDLENFVYFKDDTHYFVMTAKKSCLLKKGVLNQDYSDSYTLLSRENINHKALVEFAREAADASTKHQIPMLEFAKNHHDEEDVAIFDFTAMYSATHSCRVVEMNGYTLLLNIVGDTLLEPFWPTGSGIGRGFLGVLDCAWLIRNWGLQEKDAVELIAERESMRCMLSKSHPNTLSQKFNRYSIDPSTRYHRFVKTDAVTVSQVRHLISDQIQGNDESQTDKEADTKEKSKMAEKHPRGPSVSPGTLLKWFQEKLSPYKNVVTVNDLMSSWRNGLALCSLVHLYRPELIPLDTLLPEDVAFNTQMALDIIQQEFGVIPLMNGADMEKWEVPDKLIMMSYLTQLYECLEHEPPRKVAKLSPAVQNGESPEAGKPRLPSAVGMLMMMSKREAQQVKQRMEASTNPDETQISLKAQRVQTPPKANPMEITEETISTDDPPDVEPKQDGNANDKPSDMIAHGQDHREQVVQDVKPGREGHQDTNQKRTEACSGGRGILTTTVMVAEPGKDESNVDKYQCKTDLRQKEKEKLPGLLREKEEDKPELYESASLPKNRLSVGIMAAKIEEIEKQESQRQQQLKDIGHLTETSDTCCVCKGRLYMVERHSAQGYFFHRDCFRCCQCDSRLRLGKYIMHKEENEAKFYCYQHYYMKGLHQVNQRDTDREALEKIIRIKQNLKSIRTHSVTGRARDQTDNDVRMSKKMVLNREERHVSENSDISPAEKDECTAMDTSDPEETDIVSPALSPARDSASPQLSPNLSRSNRSLSMLRGHELQDMLEDVENEECELEESGLEVEKELCSEAQTDTEKQPEMMDKWLDVLRKKKELMNQKSKLMLQYVSRTDLDKWWRSYVVKTDGGPRNFLGGCGGMLGDGVLDILNVGQPVQNWYGTKKKSRRRFLPSITLNRIPCLCGTSVLQASYL